MRTGLPLFIRTTINYPRMIYTVKYFILSLLKMNSWSDIFGA